MLAYMRTYVAPDFLVYGEMIHPGTIADEENDFFNFDYEYYFAMGAEIPLASKPNGTKAHRFPYQVEHKGNWEARPLLTNAWRNIDPEEQIPGQEPFCPAALYAIVNTSDDRRAFSFRIDTDFFGGARCTWRNLRMKPDDESTWDQWNSDGLVFLQPQNGWIRESFQLRLSPHEVYLIKITPWLI